MKTLLKKSLFTTLGLAMSIYSMAQTEVFKVLASRGKNTLADGSAVFAGKKLGASDIIKVGEGSYLGLIHSTGKTLEVKEAGTYKIGELSSKAIAKSSSITKKYSDYVIGELTKAESSDIHANYQKNMKVTGSVERAIGDFSKMILPKQSNIINNVNTLSWAKVAKATSYTLEVSNMFDDIILSKELTDTVFILDLAAVKMPKDQTIMVKVKANGTDAQPDSYVLKSLVPTKSPEVFADKDQLAKEFSDESALNYMMKASFYAQNNLFVDAKDAFEKAIKLEPSVSEFKSAYMNFLSKNQLLQYYPYEK
ncbi:MAG: hypothetical protein EAZ06_11675 [Cytophagales bacterium]|nr:MAG: hypothetical protein EAZ06_11675 [Cytophagales bacterium]